MKRFVLFPVVACVGLVSCSPLDTYYRAGASVSLLNRDTTDCQVRALRDVPPSTEVYQYPPEYVPPVRKCRKDGRCKTVRRGFYIPGDVVAFDPNADLRDRVVGQCMAEKGYTPVSIPPCPDSVARAAPRGVTERLPVLTPKSCVIRNRDGSVQIVTRG